MQHLALCAGDARASGVGVAGTKLVSPIPVIQLLLHAAGGRARSVRVCGAGSRAAGRVAPHSHPSSTDRPAPGRGRGRGRGRARAWRGPRPRPSVALSRTRSARTRPEGAASPQGPGLGPGGPGRRGARREL